jgi:mRNA interferase MazF
MGSPESHHHGDVWLVALGAGRPGEPGKTRPAIIVSVDALSSGTDAGLIIVVPLSSSLASSHLRIEITPGTAGVESPSRAICRALRAVDPSRLVRRIGHVSQDDMSRIEAALALILGIEAGPSAT